jgi:hypothetical protein
LQIDNAVEGRQRFLQLCLLSNLNNLLVVRLPHETNEPENNGEEAAVVHFLELVPGEILAVSLTGGGVDAQRRREP